MIKGVFAIRKRLECIKGDNGDYHPADIEEKFVAFADAEVEMHIPHKYSVESSLKSQIVSLHEKFCIMNHLYKWLL